MSQFLFTKTHFTELYNYCQTNYSEDIWQNLDILYRNVWSIHPDHRQLDLWKNLKRTIGSRFLLEYRFFKSFVKSSVENTSRAKKSSVLVAFVPCRSDYQALIYPVTNILSEEGLKVTILVPEKRFQQAVSPNLFSGSYFHLVRDGLTISQYRAAKADYRTLLPEIKDLSNHLRLNRTQDLLTRLFFMRYFEQKVKFRGILDKVRPSLLYGLHYITKPGFAAAIRDFNQRGFNTKSILIQHGFFSGNSPFHDFTKGADIVLLWGEYFKEQLEKKKLLPAPQIKVFGNPKLEAAFRKVGEEKDVFPSQKGCGTLVVLFISTPVEHNAEALELFAHTEREAPHWTGFYRPHPTERRGKSDAYDNLLQKGLINSDQIMDRGDTYDMIREAKVVVGTQSTAVLEAIAFGKPVIQVLPELFDSDWAEYSIETASSQSELQEKICALIEDRKYRDYVLESQQHLLRAMFQRIEGASQEIAAFLERWL